MSQHRARFHRHTEAARDAQKIARIMLETGESAPITSRAGATNGGDERKLRGIPAIGRGVTGAIPGTSPHQRR